MNRFRPTAVILTAFLVLGIGTGCTPRYLPQEGDHVVVYINRFDPEHFEKAQQILVEEFGAAATASGQTRRTYWIVNPETHETMSILFFKQGHSVEEWHALAGRQEVLDKLEKLRREPQNTHHYTVISTHDSN